MRAHSGQRARLARIGVQEKSGHRGALSACKPPPRRNCRRASLRPGSVLARAASRSPLMGAVLRPFTRARKSLLPPTRIGLSRNSGHRGRAQCLTSWRSACCPTFAATATLPIGRLATVPYVSRPCAVDCGLQLSAPGRIGAGTTPNLLWAHLDFHRRFHEPHSLTEQFQQSGALFRLESPLRLQTFALSLESCAGSPAWWTGASSARS
jgi:hypothetical protein